MNRISLKNTFAPSASPELNLSKAAYFQSYITRYLSTLRYFCDREIDFVKVLRKVFLAPLK